jgi:hypothetical protein
VVGKTVKKIRMDRLRGNEENTAELEQSEQTSYSTQS